MTETHCCHIPTSQADEGIETVAQRWSENVLQITEDLRSIFHRIPRGGLFERDVLEILVCLQLANRDVKALLEELRHERVIH